MDLNYEFEGLRWHTATAMEPGRLVLPITDIKYPEGMDEMIGAVLSRDAGAPGWVGMPVLEAEGGEYTETVRNAESLTFLIPMGYDIEHLDRADIRLCFRVHNSSGATPDYDEHHLVIPERV